MKIKKVDDKPIVIHVHEKPKIHQHQPKKVEIKARGVYSTHRVSTTGIKSANRIDKKKHTKYSVSHKANIPMVQPKDSHKQKTSNISKDTRPNIKSRNDIVKIAGLSIAKASTDQLEGGQEVQQATGIAYTGIQLATGTVSKGADLYKNKVLEEKRRKFKVLNHRSRNEKSNINSSKNQSKTSETKRVVKETDKQNTKKTKHDGKTASSNTTGSKTANRSAITSARNSSVSKVTRKSMSEKFDKVETASYNRNRKIQFFMDKMKSQEEQTDNILKVAKDIISKQAMILMKKAMTSIAAVILPVFLFIAIAALPVVAFVTIIYNSPFAIFFPPLQEGDTVLSVAQEYESDFMQTVTTLANEHIGYDEGEVVYVDYEGAAAVPSNYYDVVAVYMVKYGVGDTASVINETTKGRLKTVYDDMCSYHTTEEIKTETVEKEDGTTTTLTTNILKVNVRLKSYQHMIGEYNFSEDEVTMLNDLMNPEYLAMIGYTGGNGGESSGGNSKSDLSDSEIEDIVSGITNQKAKQTLTFALSKVGYPYSQAYRDSGNYYDCSSLAYYARKSAGVDISYHGATTAAAEGQGLEEAGKSVTYEEMQPGDLIFYSYCKNGRYKNISHVAIYAGNGKVVEAANESIGVVYRNIQGIGSIVLIARP
ncbi:C40 family peptidase [Lachnotalea glycerini]|uniref:Hydrolase n=1 Tax=Lachnotalea glycerini TaxID=1763509 RepID=A0A371JBL9_9FIRM|nr:C40 family peptidase [Lachnotalea glycerini]RDY30144.1 hydrolase [Lachnotalea glycerini]